MKYFFSHLFNRFVSDRRGNSILFVVIFGTLAVTVASAGIASYAVFEHRTSARYFERDAALHIAEAGIEYYRWHLSHDAEDYMDGTGLPGPYVHPYEDKDGAVVGYFSLEIDAPLSGSTVVTMRSTGWTVAEPTLRRTIQARVGFPSVADHTFLQNSNMRFSPTTVVHGRVHSNGGIQFDGTTDAEVMSARVTYLDGFVTRPGVWGSGGPVQFFIFPVPARDFTAITADLSLLRDNAIAGGVYLTSSGVQGYQLVFQSNGTFDVYRVLTRRGYAGASPCWFNPLFWCPATLNYDLATREYVTNYTIPSNGAIFVEDHVWVEGVVNGRVTVGAGRFPVSAATYRDIMIQNNLTYAETGSDDVLGLIAQRDIIVPHDVPTDMTIHAAALSQFGSTYRPFYTAHTRTNLVFFGSQISFNGGGWKYGNPVVSGFTNTNHLHDENLRYYPPPGFPVGTTYDLISWEELQT